MYVFSRNEAVPTATPTPATPLDKLQLLPNPSSGPLLVRNLGRPLPSAQIMIYNASGQCLLTARLDQLYEWQTDLSAWPAGWYLVRVEVPGYTPYSWSWIKQK